MPFITDFPDIVNNALPHFEEVFRNKAQKRHFAEYVTGLILARKKNVSAINREFIDAGDQSCLNRFINSEDWDVEGINDLRLKWIQRQPGCEYHEKGVIPLDNVLIDKHGKRMDDVGWFWNHAEQRHKIAQDYLIVNYVCPSNKHFPLHFRRFTKREQCRPSAPDGPDFKDHGVLFRELVDFVVGREIPGAFTFDCWFSGKDNLEHIHAAERWYVADLKSNRKIRWRGRERRVDDVAAEIPPESRRCFRSGDDEQWFFTKTVRMPKLNHKIRVVFIWKNRDDEKPAKCLACNNLRWDGRRIARTYRKRWTGTETFHRDGKQSLGMGDCQLARRNGHDRHMMLMFLAYSLLMAGLRTEKPRGRFSREPTTIGEACRSVLENVMSKFVDRVVSWIHDEGRDVAYVRRRIGLMAA